MPTTQDFLATLTSESQRFRDAVVATESDTAVPTCPDWTADDLLWHLAEVQWFWGMIARDDVTPDQLEEPERPADRAGLLALFDEYTHTLPAALASLDPATPRWMWAQDESLHNAGYLARRQAHEALIHRVDAELTAGREPAGLSPIPADLATDGADEVLRVMFGRDHKLLTFAADPGAIVRVVASDTDTSWLLQLGRETGEVEGHGSVDDANFRVIDEGTALATITGSAVDFDLWLWNRPTIAPLQHDGDADLIARLQAVIGEGF